MVRIKVSEPPQLSYAVSDSESRLRSRLQGDLSFKGAATGYASHNTHAFAAKFPPQLPRAFIEELTEPGDTVLDPMAGSGTAVVEAALAGRFALGLDLDPLAVQIARAKTRRLDPEMVLVLGEQVTDYAQLILTKEGSTLAERLLKKSDQPTRDFLEYWFKKETICELAALRKGVEKLVGGPYRGFFDVLFSSIVVTKSGGVSLALDLAHSRPHKVADKKVRNAVQAFGEKVLRTAPTVTEMREAPGESRILRSDSRSVPLKNDSVDLVITSPPYANAIDVCESPQVFAGLVG